MPRPTFVALPRDQIMRAKSQSVDIGLPITSMLDMSFQLLAFFVLTFHPTASEGQLAASMPATQAKAEANDADGEPDLKEEYTISVFSADGELAGMSLHGPTVTRGDIRSMNGLRQLLVNLPKATAVGSGGNSIMIEASNDLTYARLVDVINTCKKAGHESISLSPLRKGPAS